MKIIPLKQNPDAYTCFAYLILGEWNRIEDINTLVDVGNDAYILDQIGELNTGVGKYPIEQVILTHNHFDHSGGLSEVNKRFPVKVKAWAAGIGIHHQLHDGEIIRMGDCYFEVIHFPGHSFDSICLYCKQEKVLFSGDSLINIRTFGGSYIQEFVEVLERLNTLDIEAIYSGHDQPILQDGWKILRRSVGNVRKSNVVDVQNQT